MKKTIIGCALVLLLSILSAAQSLHMGSVQLAMPIQGAIIFTLTSGGPGAVPCYVNNGFCWASGGNFDLHKAATVGLCINVCQFNGIVGAVSAVNTGRGCSQISFNISNADLQIGSRKLSGLNAWYSQTSCSYPSGFMGGGSLLVYAQ